MTLLSVLFLVLELVILVGAAVTGYRRGIGKTAIRVLYLTIIGLGSFFLGRFVSFRLSDIIMDTVKGIVPQDVLTLLTTAPELEVLLINLVGALIAPLFFALLFGLLQLITLIYFNTIADKIVHAVYKKEEAPSWSKWAGAGTGAIVGIAVAAVLLSPIFTVIFVAENVPDDTVTIFAEALAEETPNESAAAPSVTGVLRAQPAPLSLSIKPSFNVTKFIPWDKALVRALTTYDIPDHHTDDADHENASDVLPVLIETAGDALYAYNVTAHNGGTANDALTNAASTVIPHLDEASTIKIASADLLRAMGITLQEKGSVFGIEMPASEDPLLKSMINNLVDSLAHTTPDTVKANMVTLFNTPSISYDPVAEEKPVVSSNKGLLSTMSKLDKDDPSMSLENEELSSALAESLGNVADNSAMDAVMNDVRDYTVDMISQKDVDFADEKYQPFYEEVSQQLTAQITPHLSNPEASVKDIATDIKPVLNDYLEEYEIEVSDLHTDIVATCIAKEFSDESYIVDGELNISVSDIMNFFGISEGDLPDWAQ